MSIKVLRDAVSSAKSVLWNTSHEGYGGLGMIAPMVAGDSSDDDSGDEGTHWEHPPASIVVGSEQGISVNSLSTPTNSNQYTPVLGEPFSALIPSMWPQDILGKIQQPEDSGMHPECEYDEFGFRMENNADKEDPDPCSYAACEDPSLRLKWTAFIESTQQSVVGDLTWDMVSDTFEKSETLKELIYRGIPHSMRIHLWPRLSGALRKKKESEMSYKKVLKKSNNEDSLISSQIDKDLCRTMPSNACFQNMDSIGIKKLRNILEGVAWLYPDIGYCQGMGMICASLLLYLEEEDAFWVMVAIIEDLLPSSYYTSTLIGVQVDQRVLRQLIANCIPSLDELMKDHDIELSLITLHWFLTSMASVLQPKVLLRIWDIFFYEGSIALFKLTLGMIKSKEKELLLLENSAQIFNVLSDLPGEITDIDALLVDAEKAASSITDIIMNTHRKKHFAYLLAEASHRQDTANNNNINASSLQVYRRTRIPLKKSWVNLAYDIGIAVYDTKMFCGSDRSSPRALTMKAKNVLQTEIITELRESILMIARHFNYKGTKSDLLPDYSVDSHVKDFETFIAVTCTKQRRAKALIDFERHEDDELGFRKHDLITIISQKDEHCWIGELNGLRGWFPAKFVEVLDERSKLYESAGDDSVTETVTDLVRGKLYYALRRIFDHGLMKSFSSEVHPWLFIEEASRREVMKDFQSVYSRLVLCKTYKLDEDGKVLTPEEILYRAVQAINASHDKVKANMDVKLRSWVAYALNEQILHLWFEVLCSMDAIAQRWYHPFSFIRSPGWIQIKCELRTLAKFSFSLSVDYEIKEKELTTTNMKDDVQDMLVKHHLFSWDL